MADIWKLLATPVKTPTETLVAGTVDFYNPGTTGESNRKDVYTDAAGTIVAANPYTLDSDAIAVLYGTGTYHVVIKDSSGNTEYDYDFITPDKEVYAFTPATLAELQAITGYPGATATLLARTTLGDGGGGPVYWNSSDLSTEVAADTLSGVYVAPDSDATGASGAWVRQYSGPVNLLWFGTNGTAIQAALDYADSLGGGKVILPNGTYSLGSTTLVIPDNVWLQGLSEPAGTRGGGTDNHPLTLTYDGTGTAVKFGGTFRHNKISGVSVVAESADANYQNFTAFEINGLAYGEASNLYAEGAKRAFDFTAADDDILHSVFYNLSAYDCLEYGINTEIAVGNFMNSNQVEPRDITECGTAVRLGGGEQIHNTLNLVASELGRNTIGIHLDGDTSRQTIWQVIGQAWFEFNTSGNIVADGGTLYLGGDITGQDNNATGGIIYNGGRVLPLGRTAFDSYALAFTGFTTNGLSMAYSFRDEGTNYFYDLIGGAKADLGTSATKISTNTRFGDGVQCVSTDDSGLDINDTSIDFTADWTMAGLVFHTGGQPGYFMVQKNSGPSFLRFDLGGYYVTAYVKDNGGALTSEAIGIGDYNVKRAPYWVVMSYDATANEIRGHYVNGEVSEAWPQAMPAALSSGYDTLALGGVLSSVDSDMVIDEFLIYDRLLTPDEIVAIHELRGNLNSATGIQSPARAGETTDTTDGNGEITITHGLKSSPVFASVSVEGDHTYTADIVSRAASTMVVRVKDSDGADVGSTSVTVLWKVSL